jgi:hypothetical protein
MSWSDGLISLRTDGAATSAKSASYVAAAAERPAPVVGIGIGAHATPVALRYSSAAKPRQAKLVRHAHAALARSTKHEPQIVADKLHVDRNDIAVSTDRTRANAQEQFVLVLAHGESVSQTASGLQIRVWQLQFWVPAQQAKKQVPNKT